MSRTTVDPICRDALILEQPRRGYRFNVDSIILAHFLFTALEQPPGRLVDLGAGCGVVGLLLARWWSSSKVMLVELQQELFELARSNIQRNQLERRVCCKNCDLREIERWSTELSDLILCNPPFFKLGHGRTSPNPQVAMAKHEVACTLEQLLTAASGALAPTGVIGLIFPHDRVDELLQVVSQVGLSPLLQRPVIPLPDRPPTRALFLIGAEGGPMRQLPPLMVEKQPGRYSAEMDRILGDA